MITHRQFSEICDEFFCIFLLLPIFIVFIRFPNLIDKKLTVSTVTQTTLLNISNFPQGLKRASCNRPKFTGSSTYWSLVVFCVMQLKYVFWRAHHHHHQMSKRTRVNTTLVVTRPTLEKSSNSEWFFLCHYIKYWQRIAFVFWSNTTNAQPMSLSADWLLCWKIALQYLFDGRGQKIDETQN